MNLICLNKLWTSPAGKDSMKKQILTWPSCEIQRETNTNFQTTNKKIPTKKSRIHQGFFVDFLQERNPWLRWFTHPTFRLRLHRWTWQWVLWKSELGSWKKHRTRIAESRAWESWQEDRRWNGECWQRNRPALVNQELGVENISTYLLYIVHSKWACMCCSPMKQGNAKWSGCCRNPNTRRQDCCGSSKRWTQQNSRNDCWTTCEKRYRCSWTMLLRWWKQTPLSFSCKIFGACIYSWVTTKKTFAWLINWEMKICRKRWTSICPAVTLGLDWMCVFFNYRYIHTWQGVVSFFGMVSSRVFFKGVKSSDFQPSDRKPYKHVTLNHLANPYFTCFPWCWNNLKRHPAIPPEVNGVWMSSSLKGISLVDM